MKFSTVSHSGYLTITLYGIFENGAVGWIRMIKATEIPNEYQNTRLASSH
jgi:hypothetical protein